MATRKRASTAQGNDQESTDNGTSSGVKTYTVVNAVNHDQQLYEPGELIDLDDETAAPLLKVGAIAGDDTTA